MPRESEAYKKATRAVKKRVRYIRNQKLRYEAESINRHATRRETEELLRQMKSNEPAFKDTKRSNKCDADKLKQYFYDHFNKKTEPVLQIRSRLCRIALRT